MARNAKTNKPAPRTASAARSRATAGKAKRPARGSGKGRAAPVPKGPDRLRLYRDMLLVRRFEERAGQLYGMGQIGGFCHLYIGQEAVVVGTQAALGPEDTMITGYREHGHLLAAGVDPRVVMAELMGRSTGISKGKGGSMHMFAPDKRFYGGHGIVGAPAPLGTGLAFAHHYRGSDAVSVTFFGDGAANQGQVFESFNMAELWKLPVLYVIENNRYAMGTAVRRASAQTHLYRRGASFRIPGDEVDGMDVLAVHDAVADSLAWIRAGNGPKLLEMKTYRYRGHSMSDPAKYRTREEVQKVKAEHDPIDHLRQRILDDGLADEAAIKEIEAEVKTVVAEAVEFASDSPEPDLAELYTDIVV